MINHTPNAQNADASALFKTARALFFNQTPILILHDFSELPLSLSWQQAVDLWYENK
jgi:hypothetical protein